MVQLLPADTIKWFLVIVIKNKTMNIGGTFMYGRYIPIRVKADAIDSIAFAASWLRLILRFFKNTMSV
jgi:hypothetical protein